MKSMTVLLVGFLIVSAAGCASASGVVIAETQQIKRGGKTVRETKQTIMIQGNQQKLVNDRFTSIVDLDKGKMYRINSNTKSYMEFDFPPPMPQALSLMNSLKSTMALKPSGATREVSGYKCADYVNQQKMGNRDVSITECLSTDAPGAQAFTAFQDAMAAKLKGTGAKLPPGELPKGLPLLMEATVKMEPIVNPKMKPDMLAKLNARFAKQPPMANTTTVTKIEAKNLAADEFVVPTSYKKQELPKPFRMRMGGGLHPMPPHPGAPAAAAGAKPVPAPAQAAPAPAAH